MEFHITEGSEVWIPSNSTVWEEATVLARSGSLATVRSDSTGDVVQLDLEKVPAYLKNPSVYNDITSMHHINEPCILYNLQERSRNNEPYTLMGSVLVAVNPLKMIKDPEGILGSKQAASHPHPFGTAEIAYSQMVFAESRPKDPDSVINQSIVISGESGAGKTESSKMVLNHLVARIDSKKSSDLDKRLLGSNPILEGFGNASTLRNHNSSRFGKFMKLHFKPKTKKGEATQWELSGASIEHYLLERSRITSHNHGERSYHIFYQLKNGAPSDLTKELGLSESEYRYMKPSGDEKIPASATKMTVDDKADFAAVDKSLDDIRLESSQKKELYRVIAGILHLGNIEFDNEERPEGDCAIVKESPAGKYSPLEWSAKMLGVDKDKLSEMLREHEVKAGLEKVMKRRNAQAATYARDAVAKSTYARLFDWIVDRVSYSLAGADDTKDMPFIGVLDIFGFESFERNDFEQLLINFTNEALQGTFNRQVFVAELDLYKKEGLIMEGEMQEPPSNNECMQLLQGTPKNAPGGNSKGAPTPESMGLLKLIDSETQAPQPSDEKMNRNLHRAFEKHPNFMRPHPKDKARQFIVKHYAGAVIYTVGMFSEKNVDRLPKEVGALFEQSSSEVVKILFGSSTDKSTKIQRTFGGASIIGKFQTQIQHLITTLESTRATFVRCVKPNPAMERKDSDISWFDRRYVTQQLKCLSVPQTAEVLKTGLPTRIPYDSLTEQYKNILPKEAINVWKKLGGGDNQGFMRALFWAFKVPETSYRCGLTRVFFRSGELSQLEEILSAASKWGQSGGGGQEKDEIVKRFKYFYVRVKWRKAIVKVIAVNRFALLLDKARGRAGAAAKVQALLKMNVAKKRHNRNKQGALMAQKLFRAKLAKKKAEKLREEKRAEARRKAEEAKKREEEARRKAEEDRKKAEEERKKREEEAAAAKAAADEKRMKEIEEQNKKAEEEEKKREEEAARYQKEREEFEKEEQKELEQQEKDRKAEEEEAEKARAEYEALREAESKESKGSKSTSSKSKAKTKESKASATGGGTRARRGSGVRAADASYMGPEAVRALRHKADEAVRKDEKKFQKPKVGHLKMLIKSKLSGNSWKTRFFVLDRPKRTFAYYKSGDERKRVGKGSPKGTFRITPDTTVEVLPEKDKRQEVLHIKDPKNGEIFVALGSESKSDDTIDKWKRNIEATAHGFKPTHATQKLLDEAKKAEESLNSSTNGAPNGDMAEAAQSSPPDIDYDQIDVANLPPHIADQLSKIESLLETGMLSREEVEDLRPHILQQAQEEMLINEEGGGFYDDEEQQIPMLQPSMLQSQEMPFNDGDNYVQCQQCFSLNYSGGHTCWVCGATLPSAQRDAQATSFNPGQLDQIAPSGSQSAYQGSVDGDILCDMKYKEGKFYCFMLSPELALDPETWLQQPLFVVGCQLFRGDQLIEAWTVRHSFEWIFEHFHTPASKTKGIKVPSFPDVSAPTSNQEAILKRRDALREYLRELFKLNAGKNEEKFLKLDVMEKLLKINENTLEQIDPKTLERDYVMKYQADESQPLDEEELGLAEEAAQMLLTSIRGSETTRALPIDDPTIVQYEQVCSNLKPRLFATMDPSMAGVTQELAQKAGTVLDKIEQALTLYQDTLSAMYAMQYGMDQ